MKKTIQWKEYASTNEHFEIRNNQRLSAERAGAKTDGLRRRLRYWAGQATPYEAVWAAVSRRWPIVAMLAGVTWSPK